MYILSHDDVNIISYTTKSLSLKCFKELNLFNMSLGDRINAKISEETN